MSHYPKPFFRKSRGLWYVQIAGKQHNLGPDRTAAFERYHALMQQPAEQRVASDTVVAIIDAFLDWCQKHRAPDTYEWYRWRLQLFAQPLEFPRFVRKSYRYRCYHCYLWCTEQKLSRNPATPRVLP